MNLTLIRHPAVAVSGLCYGRSQVALRPDWPSLLPLLRKALPNPLPRIYTSPSPRCLVLAGILGGPDVQADDRLQELDFGVWEMRPWEDLPADEVQAWAEDLESAVPHGGESGADLMERAAAFFSDRVAADEDALVITHAGWIRALLAVLLSTDLDHAFRLDIGFLSQTHLVVQDDMIRITAVNSMPTAPPTGQGP